MRHSRPKEGANAKRSSSLFQKLLRSKQRHRKIPLGSVISKGFWKLCLYARNGEKLKEMLTEDQAERNEKTMDAYNEVLPQSEVEAFGFGFTLAARLLTEVTQSLEFPSINDI